MIDVSVFVDITLIKWIDICVIFSVLSYAIGFVYFAIGFLIKGLIYLEVRIKSVKVLGEAIRLYKEKQKAEKIIKDDIRNFIREEKEKVKNKNE